ncbi:DNA helicase [Tanacetum coccineum]
MTSLNSIQSRVTFSTSDAAVPLKGCLLGDDREWDIALKESVYPPKLWRKHWEAMQDDIPAKISEATGIGWVSVKEFGLPSLSERLLKDLKNKLLMEEKNYKRDTLMQETTLLVPKLNEDQKKIYNLIINASEESRQELLFVYGHASSGIASLLLPAGRTTHSRFKLPLELTDESVCHAKKHSQLGNLLVETNLIIWDEAPMNDKRCFEALDRTLKDLMNAPKTLFGGKTVILGGDFRQTLPVKKGAAKQELIHASIAESYLWICRRLINFIYDEATLKTPTASAFQEKAIVCPKNDTVDAVNARILSSVEGVTKTYLSTDEAIPLGRETSETDMLYPMEYLNTITFPGFPPHELQLKVGSPIMLLRNVNLSGGLCNGTRMIVISLMSRPFICMSITAIASLKVRQEDYVIEAKVYRKWTSKSIPEMKDQAFCCILIDRENTAIQATMDLKSLTYFDQLLKLKKAYRISNFICENTSLQQLLENSKLEIRTITSFEVLPGKAI